MRSGSTWLDEAGHELRQALRYLRHNPGLTAAAVLTLALCIGANTAIFSVIDRVLLRPLPYPHPERLVEVATAWRGEDGAGVAAALDGHAFQVIRERARFLDSAAVGLAGGVNFGAQGKPEYVQQQRVSAGFFRVLGVHPRLGREFTAEEDRAGGPAVVVLSHSLWQRAFHADPAVIGRAVALAGERAIVVGVMPAGFEAGAPADLWTTLRPAETGEGERGNYQVVARLRPSATLAAAEAQVGGLSAAALTEQVQPGVTFRLQLIPLQRGRTLATRTPLLVLFAAAGAVLLMGCGNVAGLLLARSAGRSREIATRIALGGSRPAIVQQLLTESLLLAAASGTAGLALGWLGVRGLKLLAQGTFELPAVRLDLRVLVATAGLSLLSSLLFGLLPALRASDVDLRSAIAATGAPSGRVIGGGVPRWPRRLLVAAEVALGMVLLIAAGLLVRSLVALSQLRPGFEAANVLTAKLSLHDARYRTSRQVARMFEAGLSRIRELPGVEAAAVGLAVPYERWLYMGFRRLDGRHPTGGVQNLVLNYVTADYFATLRIPVLRGRAIGGGDRADSAPVVVVSEAFARKYMAGQEVIGTRISISGEARQIVGVVGDVQQRRGWEDSSPLAAVWPLPAAYIPVSQMGDDLLQMVHIWFSPSWVVRAAVPPAAILAGIQRAVEAVDPQLPVAGFHTMAEVRSDSLRGRRFLAILLALFAGLALTLAAVGIYGLLASAVAERTHELGIRMALGATVRQAMTAVALPGILLALVGIAGGSLLARLAGRVLRHLLWGVSPTDPLTFAAVPLLLLGVAVAASVLSTRRLARLDPARTLRHE
jgi:predicted permease